MSIALLNHEHYATVEQALLDMRDDFKKDLYVVQREGGKEERLDGIPDADIKEHMEALAEMNAESYFNRYYFEEEERLEADFQESTISSAVCTYVKGLQKAKAKVLHQHNKVVFYANLLKGMQCILYQIETSYLDDGHELVEYRANALSFARSLNERLLYKLAVSRTEYVEADWFIEL